MANKYLDREGNKITGKQYLHFSSLGKAYSEIKVVVFNDEARLSIDWEGSFDKSIPDYLLTPFRVNVAMNVNDRFVTEPTPFSSCFRDIEAAIVMFELIRAELKEKYGESTDPINPMFEIEKDDIEDFGEVEVPKDQPKTKSKKLGCW